MSKATTIKFKGSKVYFQKKVETPTTVPVTAVTATNPATLTATGLTAVKGDVITVTGLEGFEGSYVVASVATGTVTLANTDWSGKTVPTDFEDALAGTIQYVTEFCQLKSFQKSGSTVAQEDVSTICSVDGPEFEGGDREEGTITLQFWYDMTNPVQEQLEDYEFSQEKFWTKVELANNKGTVLFYGGIETGLNMDGATGSPGRWDSGCAIRVSGRRYNVKPGA